jgi:hypothetical protein
MPNATAGFSARAFAVMGALPLIVLFAVLAVSEVRNFFDPCFVWGAGRSEQSISIRPGDPCQSVSSTSETQFGAIGRLLLVHGTGVVAACLGLIGAFRSRPKATLLGAGLLFILSIPLMLGRFGIVVLLFTVLLFVSYRLSRDRRPSAAGDADRELDT